jgi:hypothetical protein
MSTTMRSVSWRERLESSNLILYITLARREER